MKKFMAALSFCFLSIAVTTTAVAQETAVVAGLQAPAWVERSGTKYPLRAGESLSAGDRLHTGKGGKVLLDMPDASNIKLGEQVQFEIREMKAAQAGQPFTGFLRVLAGAFRYTTAKSGKNIARELNIQVGTATMGIRGTDVWGKTDSSQDLICLIEGRIEITRSGEAPVSMQEALTVYTADPKQKANPLHVIDTEKLQVLAQETELLAGEGVMQTGGQYTLYLHSLRNAVEAENLQKRLQRDGYAAEIHSVEIKNETWHRVGLRDFASLDDARRLGVKLEQIYGISGVWVDRLREGAVEIINRK